MNDIFYFCAEAIAQLVHKSRRSKEKSVQCVWFLKMARFWDFKIFSSKSDLISPFSAWVQRTLLLTLRSEDWKHFIEPTRRYQNETGEILTTSLIYWLDLKFENDFQMCFYTVTSQISHENYNTMEHKLTTLVIRAFMWI